jgi:hypothetical protein
VAFGSLACAFTISALYQAYRAMLMEIPEDAFTLTTGLSYAAMAGLATLVLTGKRWAWWSTSVLVLSLLGIATFFYFPDVATVRDMGPIDWLESTLYLALISVAGFVCALKLSGIRLVSSND